MRILENLVLSSTIAWRMKGPLKLDPGLFRLFLSLPEDPLPGFCGAEPGIKGRGRDHPRYGRWMMAFVKFYRPYLVVEVGTNAGGTAVGTARALAENGSGRLVCVDNGEGAPRSFPDIARGNIIATGLAADRFELICDGSLSAIPKLAERFPGKADIYLIDAAHTFDAADKDIENGLKMMKKGGYILVHDIDPRLDLGSEAEEGHPAPVLEAFNKAVRLHGFEWCVVKFIRKHLGIIRV
jgi:predicted O-methyltransferase YrrM